MAQRDLHPYEKNHLLKFGFSPEDIDQYGETPVEYITGKAHFLGQTFSVTPDVLIPRVETEELVELIQNEWQPTPYLRGIEVGTGSGAIGISLAQFWSRHKQLFELTLTDVSQPALEVAQENAQDLLAPVDTQKVSFRQADLLESFSQPVDLIVANLPYIPSKRLKMLDASVKEYEPMLALDGGENGFRIISQLIEQAKTILAPGGKLYLEVDDTHTLSKFSAFLSAFDVRVLHDSHGKNRFAVLKKRPLP